MYNGSSDRYHPENKLTDTQQSPDDECGGFEAAAVMYPSQQQRDLGRRYLTAHESAEKRPIQLQHSN